jgi:hypothetical protein
MSASSERSVSSSEQDRTPADLWIAEAREDAELAFVSAYSKDPPYIGEKAAAYVKLYKDLEVIRSVLPNVAEQMKVRYVDYKSIYKKIKRGTLVSQIDDDLRNHEGDAIKYHNGIHRFLDATGDTFIYRNPSSPQHFLTINEYLKLRLEGIDDDSGIGVMLVDMGQKPALDKVKTRTPDELTANGSSHLALPGSKPIELDGLGIIEWLAIVSQPVTVKTDPGSAVQTVELRLPQLGASWLLANRLPGGNNTLSNHVLFSNFDYEVKRNHISLKPPTLSIENACVIRTAIVR